MEKTIVRILEDTKLSAALLAKLEEQLPGYTLETFKAHPDDKSSIKRRIDSLHDAFLFILDAYPPDPAFTTHNKEFLKVYAAGVLPDFDTLSERLKKLDSSEHLAELHKELERFSSSLITVLRSEWKGPWGVINLEQATALLNEAEQYVVMSKGRPHTATLTAMDFGRGTEYLLQVDKVLPAYYEQWLAELQVIRACPYSSALDWFVQLKPYEQIYLSTAELNLATPALILEDLSSLKDSWIRAKNAAINPDVDLGKIHKNEQPFPQWFSNLSLAQQELFKILAASPVNTVEELIVKFIASLEAKNAQPAFKNDLDLVRQLPLWYLVLPRHQKIFLKYVINDTEHIEKVVYYLPSRLRMLPASANFLGHKLFILNESEGIVPLSPWSFRSSHVISRDMNKPEFVAVRSRHSDSNLEQVLRYAKPEQKILFQTLISPIWTPLISELTPDAALHTQACAAVLRRLDKKRIFQHNHAFNMAKNIFGTAAGDERSKAIIEDTEEALQSIGRIQQEIRKKEQELNLLICAEDLQEEEGSWSAKIMTCKQQLADLKRELPVFHDKSDMLFDLLNNYKAVLQSPVGTSNVLDYTGRELFLSSLEHLIFITRDGYSYGSCVSGKDRKAIELLHTDAMLIYHRRYRAWPTLSDVPLNRSRFVALVADLYCTGHQQALAGQNAPGAEGIKTVHSYFPKDICTEINRRFGGMDRLKCDDRLASDNEVKNIFHRSTPVALPPAESKPFMIACQLGKELCDKLYNALALLINQKGLFIKAKKDPLRFWDKTVPGSNGPKKENDLPTGISNILSLVHDISVGKSNIQRIAKIIIIVAARDERDLSRNKTTLAVYKGIRGLVENSVSTDNLQEYAENLTKEWSRIFNQSKEDNSGHSSSDDESVNSSPLSVGTNA